jgi:hypothetical protein
MKGNLFLLRLHAMIYYFAEQSTVLYALHGYSLYMYVIPSQCNGFFSLQLLSGKKKKYRFGLLFFGFVCKPNYQRLGKDNNMKVNLR